MSTWGGNPSFDAFKLPDEHEELRSVLRDLCETQIAPYAADVDERARFPDEALKALTTSPSSGSCAMPRSPRSMRAPTRFNAS
ncbi:FPC/CPF motif-containing protein YcgG [Mycobacterium sp. AZCC_0083]|nr:FPC/CPF motif-containing protein YcgG [Mycobacterium sp. AZCC_0083]